MIQSHAETEPGGLSRLRKRFGRVRPTYVLITFGILVALAIVVATVLLLRDLRARELAQAGREIDNLSHILAEQTTRAVQSVGLILRETETRLLEGRASGFLMDERAVNALLRARIAGVPQVRTLSVVNADGVMVRSSGNLPATKLWVGDRDYFTLHRDNPGRAPYLDRPIRNRVDGEWAVSMSRQLRGRGDSFDGVILAAIDPAYFEESYGSINLGEGSVISLFLRDGTLIAKRPNLDASIGKSFAGSATFRALQSQPTGSGEGLLRTTDGAPQLIAYRELSDFPLVVTVAVSESVVLAGWRRQAMFVVAGAAGVILILALAAALLTRELAREEALAQALRESEVRTHGIIESAMDGIITVDRDRRIVLFNPAAERIFGCSAADAIGTKLHRFIPPRFRASHALHMDAYDQTGATMRAVGKQLDLIGLRANGEEFHADISFSQLATGGTKLYTAIVRDASARRQAEEELRRSHQQLRELSASQQEVREEERTRIARELHDEMGQQLTGLKMDLSWIETRLRDDQAGLGEKVNGMKRLVDAAVGSMRRIASELRPLMLDDLGLAAAVEWLALDFSRRTGIEVKLDLDAGIDGLDGSLSTSVFRIVQESLTNVARHADASRAGVSLAQVADQLVLKVRDDGKGMPSAGTGQTRSFGLIGIRERAYMFGGEMRISSQPGEGTTIEVTIPIRNAETREQTQ